MEPKKNQQAKKQDGGQKRRTPRPTWAIAAAARRKADRAKKAQSPEALAAKATRRARIVERAAAKTGDAKLAQDPAFLALFNHRPTNKLARSVRRHLARELQPPTLEV